MAEEESSTLAGFVKSLKSLLSENSFIVRIYYESMIDNFESFDVSHDREGFTELKKKFEAMSPTKGMAPTLGDLFEIEVALLRHMSDKAILSGFWSIEDRFRRVVPAGVADSYYRRTPPRGDDEWKDIAFVREQSRCLLDKIHNNYEINLGREQSIKRVMIIIALAALPILGMGALVALTSLTAIERQGMALIVISGMVGAMISIVNRLQKATALDAMTQDGIFQLIGLRTGWVSILMSIGIGGVFALLLYGMVMGGLSGVILPNPEPPAGSPEDSAAKQEADANAGLPTKDSVDSEATQDDKEVGPTADPDTPDRATGGRTAQGPDIVFPTALAASAATASVDGAIGPAAKGEAKRPSKANSKGGADVSALAKVEKRWIERIAEALGFESVTEVYKMLVLAFLAGFAEQLVPDILNRLSKQDKLKP